MVSYNIAWYSSWICNDRTYIILRLIKITIYFTHSCIVVCHLWIFLRKGILFSIKTELHCTIKNKEKNEHIHSGAIIIKWSSTQCKIEQYNENYIFMIITLLSWHCIMRYIIFPVLFPGNPSITPWVASHYDHLAACLAVLLWGHHPI